MQDRKLSKILGSQLNVYEILSLVALALLLIIPLYFYDQLPERMPIHYNGKGEADGFGTTKSVWVLPGLGAFLYIFLTALKRLPFYKKPMDKRPIDVQKQEHQLAMVLMTNLKVVILWLLAISLWFMCSRAASGVHHLPSGLLPLFLISVFVVIGWNIKQMMELK